MHPENFERSELPYSSRYTLLWNGSTPPAAPPPVLSRLQSMLNYVHLRWQINTARRRVSNDNVRALMSMVAIMEALSPPAPPTFVQLLLRPFRKIYYRLKDKFFPEPEVPYTCPCCEH